MRSTGPPQVCQNWLTHGLCNMKSDVVMVGIMLIGDFIFVFLGLDLVLYIEGYLYILYVTLFRLIVLYSWCRVNRGTNMFVVCVSCNISCYCFHCMLRPRMAFPNLWGASPLSCNPLHTTLVEEVPFLSNPLYLFPASFSSQSIAH